jgi:hypothetical protein
MSLQSIWQGVAGRLRGNIGATIDNNPLNITTDAYGRLVAGILTASDHGAADEGSYFVGSGGVAGSSAVVTTGPASSVPSDTAPFFLMMNTAVIGRVPPGPNIWLKRVYVLLSGTQTSETLLAIQGQLDNGQLYTSGGTKLTTYFGTIVKAAKTASVIYCARSNPRSTIPVAGDEYIWKAGASEGPSSFISSTAGATRQVIELGPIVIPPGWTFSLHLAFGATSTGAPAIEVETGHIER